MAIDDIVRRISEDAANEAASLVAAAEQDAARTRDEAVAKAEAEAAATLARGKTLAMRDAETIMANTRLAERDATVSARLEADAAVLVGAEATLTALPDPEYAAYIARGVAAAATGGETIRVGGADADRLVSVLPAALVAAGVSTVTIGDVSPDGSRGVSVEGDRVRVYVSPAAAIDERRAELMALADRELFGAGE